MSLVEKLTDKKALVVLYMNGCYKLITDILYTHGASKVLLEAVVPYSKPASKALYQPYLPDKKKVVSKDTAEALAKAACNRAIELCALRIYDINQYDKPLPTVNQEELDRYDNTQLFVGVGVTADYDKQTCYMAISIRKKSKSKRYDESIELTSVLSDRQAMDYAFTDRLYSFIEEKVHLNHSGNKAVIAGSKKRNIKQMKQ